MNRIATTVILALVFTAVLSGTLMAGRNEKGHDPAIAQTQHEMNQEAENDYKKSDAELNRVYRELMGHISGDQKKALIDAELAWIKFRDSNCACWALVHKGGSIYPLMYFGHLKTMTDDRIRQLKFMKQDMLIDEGH
jgi:uncharacterized protein YecT (DUF1311 family)